VDLVSRGEQSDASMRPRAAPPILSRQVSSQGGEIREEAAEVRQATAATRERGPTLEDLLAPERRQDATARKERVQLVHSALPNGGAVMKRLKDRAARERPSTSAEKWHALRNGKPKPLDGDRRNAFDALIYADVMALAETGKIDFWVAAATMRAAVVDGTLGHGILAPDRQLLLKTLDRMAMHVALNYESKNLNVTSDTLPAFTNSQVLEKPTMLGSGTYNSVFAVKLQNPDGSVFDGVFKPLTRTDRGWAAGATGIPEDDPQTAMRNIATLSYAKKLGLDVIVDTRLALIDTDTGRGVPELGLIMERSLGEPAYRITDVSVLTRPDVCAEVTKLQLLDHLTGQGDRHAGNYFIHIPPNGRAKVMGIDNDQCFGKNMTDPAGIQRVDGDPERWGFRGTGLPPVVDTEMEHKINKLTERNIRFMLGNKLSEEEIEAAISRHKGLKIHIAQLRSAGRVIEPEQWGRADVQLRLSAKNSYVERERVKAFAWQAGWQGIKALHHSRRRAACDVSTRRDARGRAASARNNIW